MSKVEKARELIEDHGFSRNSNKTYEQYEKTYSGRAARYSSWVREVTVTIELYTDEDDTECGKADIQNVEIDDCENLADLQAVQDAIEQAVDDVKELQYELEDLEGDEE